jgi:hypothetical protein
VARALASANDACPTDEPHGGAEPIVVSAGLHPVHCGWCGVVSSHTAVPHSTGMCAPCLALARAEFATRRAPPSPLAGRMIFARPKVREKAGKDNNVLKENNMKKNEHRHSSISHRAGGSWLARAAGVALLGLLVLGASNARADSISYQLVLGNPAISGFAGPYASVLVDLTSPTTATITFTSYTGGSNPYLLGDGGSVAVNVNAASWTLGSIVGTNAGVGFTPGPWTNAGSGNENGFGSFNQRIDSFDGYSHTSDSLSFTITNTSGSWAVAAGVLTPNSGAGSVAAAHIFVTTPPANASSGALATGFAVVPESGTFALAGLGMLGLAGLGSRRRAAGAA